MPDAVGAVLVTQAVTTVARSTLVDSVRNGVVDFLTKQVQDLGKKELADRIAGMRSDAKLRGQIQGAIERATKRWSEDYADRDFVIAVAQDTQFADLPSVQAAVQAIARNPLNPVPVETLRGKFAEVLPKRFEAERTERGVVAWLEILREEFVGVLPLRHAFNITVEIAKILRLTEAGTPKADKEIDAVELRQALTQYFSLDELRTLSFDLKVDWDDLPGEEKQAKARDTRKYNRAHEYFEWRVLHRPRCCRDPWQRSTCRYRISRVVVTAAG